MIRSYRHKGLRKFATAGSKAGIQPAHAARLRRLLTALDVAVRPDDMNAPGYDLHPLKGDLAGHWAAFAFEGEDAIDVDYQDYHQGDE